MTHGHFVWTDLSTYDMPTAQRDYADLFDWAFTGDASYDFALQGDAPVAAVFPMPERLAQMDMPSFWMSYVRVADLDRTVAKARTHEGVIVEVAPESFGDDARVSLVRDPSGAGFTLYEGADITPPAQTGTATRRYHHLPDIGLISDFYRDLFGWTFRPAADAPWPVYDILHPDGFVVAQAEEVPEEVRGTFRYWMPGFSVRSVADTQAKMTARSGALAVTLSPNRLMLNDCQGAHFIVDDQGI